MGEGLGPGEGVLDLALGTGQHRLFTRILGLKGLRVETDDEVVLFFVLRDWDLRIDDVADAVEEPVAVGLDLRQLLFHRLDLCLHRLHLCNLFVARFLGPFLGRDDLLLQLVNGRPAIVYILGQVPPLLVLGQDLVDPLLRLEAGGHKLAPLGWVPPLVSSQLVNVDGHGGTLVGAIGRRRST